MAREPLKSPDSTQPAAVGPRDTSLPPAPTLGRRRLDTGVSRAGRGWNGEAGSASTQASSRKRPGASMREKIC